MTYETVSRPVRCRTSKPSSTTSVPNVSLELCTAGIEGVLQNWLSLVTAYRSVSGNVQWMRQLSKFPPPSGSPLVVLYQSELEDPAQLSNPRSTAEMLATVKAAFGLSMSQLAHVLRVKRPTVYAWLDDDQEVTALRSANRERLAQLVKLAESWNSLCVEPAREALDKLFVDGKTLFDWLSTEPLDVASIEQLMRTIAKDIGHRRHEAKARPSLAERLKARGYTEVPRSRRGSGAI